MASTSASGIPIDEAVKSYLNKYNPTSISRDPINETAIRYFCEVVEDGNPVYWDEEYARSTRFGRLIAPPQAIMTLTMGAWWMPEFVNTKLRAALNAPDAEVHGNVHDIVGEYGYTTATVVNSEFEYFESFGPDDGRIKSRTKTVNVSPPKRTRVGEGVFITTVTEYWVEKGDRKVAAHTMTVLRYRPNS